MYKDLKKISNNELSEVLNCLGEMSRLITKSYNHVTDHDYFDNIKKDIETLKKKAEKEEDSRDNRPKYGAGDKVFCSFDNTEYVVNGVRWSGRTWMYSFVDVQFRCGEVYLRKVG